ncbi:glycosyltransferase [Hominifimenecus sp. rT4P-3]|uniref:glycosyltransferase n=1 Tax=Hominifimenecus sp. rT4P-3 TaxID=3242979 RepID=UPI003DA597E6
MKKRKVLQVNKLYAPVTGGIEHVVQQLAEGLKDVTDTKVLVCQKKGKGRIEQRGGVEVHRASSFGIFFSMPISLSFLWKFRKMAKKSDIVQLHAPFPLGDLACFLSRYKGKVILWWHSDIVRQKKLLYFYRPLMNWMLKRSDLILVATEGHIEGSEFLKPYREKCKIIPYGVPRVEPVQEFREEIPVRFLFVGRLVSYKGCETLLRAFCGLDHAELVLVGDGGLRAELEALTSSLGLEGRVHFKHHLDDRQVAEEFRQCDVFVLPSISKTEAFGIVQIEAMAWGKPVINTNLPSGVPYVSLDGITGLTVPPEDEKALRSAMKKMVESPKLRKQMGEAARKRVQEHFLEKTMLENVYRIYQEMGGN